jgi:hypothetical protein
LTKLKKAIRYFARFFARPFAWLPARNISTKPAAAGESGLPLRSTTP